MIWERWIDKSIVLIHYIRNLKIVHPKVKTSSILTCLPKCIFLILLVRIKALIKFMEPRLLILQLTPVLRPTRCKLNWKLTFRRKWKVRLWSITSENQCKINLKQIVQIKTQRCNRWLRKKNKKQKNKQNLIGNQCGDIQMSKINWTKMILKFLHRCFKMERPYCTRRMKTLIIYSTTNWFQWTKWLAVSHWTIRTTVTKLSATTNYSLLEINFQKFYQNTKT